MTKFAVMLLFGFVVCQSTAVRAQNPTTDLMWEAYQQSMSMLSKDHFDDWVTANASRFDSRFQQCLNQKVKDFGTCTLEQEKICQQLPSSFQAKCRAENQCAGFQLWSVSVAARLQDGTPWLQTLQGQVLVQAGAQCKLLNICASVYQAQAETFRANAQVYRGKLLCP